MRKLGRIFLSFVMFLTLFFDTGIFSMISVYATTDDGKVIASKSSTADGRSVSVNLNVGSNSLEKVHSREIILVLDNSFSMNLQMKVFDFNFATRMDSLKSMSKVLVNSLLSSVDDGSIKIGIVTFGDEATIRSGLTNNIGTLNNAIDSMDGDGATNVQGGIALARTLFSNSSDVERSIILLTDGDPTKFYYNNELHGTGLGDTPVCVQWSVVCKKWLKPSEAAKDEANKAKNNGVVFYTVGFSTDSSDRNFLKSISGDANYYGADSSEELANAFDKIAERISIVAKDVMVVDKIPAEFSIDTDYFVSNFGEAVTQSDGSVSYGSSVNVKNNDDDSIILTWYVGNIGNGDMTYKINAKDGYYGYMYTNEEANVTGRAVDDNQYYVDKNISISLDNPIVAIPAQASDDSYSVNQGETLNINAANGVRKNDSSNLISDGGSKITDSVIEIVSVDKGTLTLNEDGSFTYVAPTDYSGDVVFKYKISTNISVENSNLNVESNEATVIITVNRIQTTYTVHHYIKDTTTVLYPDETDNGYAYDKFTGYAKSDNENYKLVGTNISKEIVLDKDNSKNVIVFYYELKQGGAILVHHYLENTEDKLADDEEYNGLVTEDYETSPMDNLLEGNYDLVATPDNALGKFSLNPTVVTYFYKLKNGANVVVHHYLKDTTESLAADEVLSGKVTTTYNSSANSNLTNGDYDLVATPNNASGTFTKEAQEVIYYYELKDGGNVTVHHYLKDTTTKLAEDDLLTGKVTKGYISLSNEDLLDGDYNLVAIPTNATGTFTKEAQEVIYYYELKDGGNVVVHHYLKDTTDSLADDEVLSGKVTEEYETSENSELTSGNYNLVATPTNAEGTFTKEAQEVIYYYELKDGGDVTVHHYLKDTTNSLADDEVLSGKVTEEYETSENSELTSGNFNLVATPTNAEGTFTKEAQEVIYYYELKDGGDVTVHHYLKDTTTKLAEDDLLTGKVTEEYNSSASSALTNGDYNLVARPTNAEGTFTKEAQEVIYYYELKDGGDVTVHHYLEDTTDSLADDEVLSGKVTEDYESNPLDGLLSGNYDLVAMPDNALGKFSLLPQTVTYFYKLKNGEKVVVYYYELGTTNELADSEELNGKVTEEYETVEKNIENWKLVEIPANATGTFTKEEQVVIYYYEKIMGKVIVKYLDEDGNSLADDIVLEGQVSTDYSTSEKEFDGYVISTINGEINGKFSEDEIVVKYIYGKTNTGNIVVNTGITGNDQPLLLLLFSVTLTLSVLLLRKRFND